MSKLRDELVGIWCALSERERGEIEDLAPDLAEILERLTGDVNRDALGAMT
ncbi:hypothetical protein [Amycolatopsis sp. NPDC058986]|uniref:hypothetical protein n=1 Tax=unclassified Amycolatopsis TaxID=2618356 RepID=UPI00366AD18A